jgi:S-adenosylmethionine hydrolase
LSSNKIILFTDFGAGDIYVGQVHAVLADCAPGVPVIDLLHTAPPFDIQAGAYLLCALQKRFQPGSIFVVVVDPGVGGPRTAMMVEADGKWFVGPDNGLLSRVIRGVSESRSHKILWKPEDLSSTFHGRDLFAPVAAMLAAGVIPDSEPLDPELPDWPDHLDRIIHIDHYGNAITGRSGDSVSIANNMVIRGHVVRYARIFSDNQTGQLFWYVNSIGFVEIAANRDSAARVLDLTVGDPCKIL